MASLVRTDPRLGKEDFTMNTHPFNASPVMLPRRARGTVIVLVVAVLALLAVIGTVYIVSARTDRASANAMNTNANLSLARMAAMNRVLETLGDAMIDQDGHVGGYKSNLGNSMAHNYDFPDDANQPWLVAHLHYPTTTIPSVSEYTRLTDKAFDPSTGTYSLAFSNLLYTAGNPLSSVVGDQTSFGSATATDLTTDDPPTGLSDAYMDLLPFSDASGIRYRVSLRILDTNRMANLNTGSTDDTAIDPNGTYFSAVRLAPQSPWPTPNAYFHTTATAYDSASPAVLLPADTPARLQSSLPANSGLGRAGLSGTYANYSASAWEGQVLRIE
jgi:Tfp pilus assembly protein FimT